MSLIQRIKHWSIVQLTRWMVLLVAVWMLFPVGIQIQSSEPVGKDTSAPFPCQHRACGCRSAQQCWKKCCCFTNTQKVAWARKNQVQLPAFVVEAARAEGAPEGALARVCCHTGGQNSPRTLTTSARPIRTSAALVLVPVLNELRCRGVEQSTWGGLTAVVPPVRSTVLSPPPLVAAYVTMDVSVLIPVDRVPPTPPPQSLMPV